MHSAWNFSGKLIILGLALWSVFSLAPEPGRAEVVKSVRARGMGLIVNGDRAAAFSQAKRAALREAVEEAVGTLISSNTQVRNFAVIEDNILSRTEGFVRSFDIVEQGAVDEHTYEVVIDAVVSLGQLQAELQALNVLIEAVGNPRILCLGQEWLAGQEIRTDMPEVDLAAALVRVLYHTGAEFNITASAALDVSDKDEKNGEIYEDFSLAAELGVRQGADLVIIGQARIVPQKGVKIPFSSTTLEETGLKPVVAEVQIKVVWADSKEVVAELRRTQKAAAVNLEAASVKAVEEGVAALATDLLAHITNDWRKKAYSSRLVRIEVEGDREQLTLFERDFPLVGGIEKIYPRTYKSSGAVYDIRSKNAAFHLARQLSAKGLAGLDVEIMQVSLNTLKLHLSE